MVRGESYCELGSAVAGRAIGKHADPIRCDAEASDTVAVVPPLDDELEVEQPTNASVLLSVAWRAWRLLGRDCGPMRTAVLRLALVTGGPPIIERVDGRPLGAIAERCRAAIDQALHELRERERLRRYRTTSRHLRGAKPPSEAPVPTAPTSALEPRLREGEPVPAQQPRADRPPTGIFRCDKQAITDRIDRLKRDVRPAEPKVEPKADPKTDAIARMAALRALHAVRRPGDGAVTPFDEVPAAPETSEPPDKRSSSVFRCEREVITDRITKLKRKPDGLPTAHPPQPPDAAQGGGSGEA